MKKVLLGVVFVILFVNISHAQVYLDKQSRHRFAQLHLGLDTEFSFGGVTQYINEFNELEDQKIQGNLIPRFIIGGTHFWGHADFYIAIPLMRPTNDLRNIDQKIEHSRGVETVFKYYPLRVQKQKIRPYVGISLAPINFRQTNKNLAFGKGPESSKEQFPLHTGLTYRTGKHFIDFGLAWNHSNTQDYYFSRTLKSDLRTQPIYVNLSFRFILETTLSAEKDWESGRTKEITAKLAEQKKLNSFYFGLGISSAIWLKNSSYNNAVRPYIPRYPTSIMPDLSIGYYLHKPDINFALGYRGYKAEVHAYGAEQMTRRNSLLIEVTKYLFDYHGFVPFIGPAFSYESLHFKEDFENQRIFDLKEDVWTYGLTFGWDIRPNRLQSWLLRTNLRWFPDLELPISDKRTISFDNIEFNFIQLIIYPGRMF